MKPKLYLLALFLFAFLNTKSQTQSKNWLVNGSSSISYIERSFSTQVIPNFSPEFGYFLFNNLLIGNKFSYSKMGAFFSPEETGRINFYHWHPYLRLYFSDFKARIYVEVGRDFQWEKSESTNVNNSFSNTIGRCGVAYFISENVSFDSYINLNLTDNGFSFFRDQFESDFVQFFFEINYFLNRNSSNSNRDILIDYLKKGNRTIEFSGSMGFKPGFFVSNYSFNKFVNQNKRWKYEFGAILDFDRTRNNLFNNFSQNFGYQPFIKIKERAYFAPTFDLSLLLGTINSLGDKELIASFRVHPSLYLFFKNSIFEMGYELETPFWEISENEKKLKERLVGNLSLSYEIFVQSNLGIKFRAIQNVFGQSKFEPFFPESAIQAIHFEIGFSYFLSPKEKSTNETQ